MTYYRLKKQRSYQVQRENTEANFQCIGKNTELSIFWLFSIMTVHVHKTQLQFSVVALLVNKAKFFENFQSLGGRVGFITG